MRLRLESCLCSAALLATFALGGCGDDNGAPLAKDASFADGAPANLAMDSGVAQDASASEAAAIDSSVDPTAYNAASPHNGIVVVNSDYNSTSISFLDRDGNLLLDGCLNSGTGTPGLAMTLSSDVVLPTQIPAGGPVAIVDRGNNALTWLDPATCAPLRQLAVGTGFASDPHDIVNLSAGKAYVTRYSENGAPTATPDDFDDGNDLLIIDPSQPKILGRIDLKPFAPAGVLPCADRALYAEGKVFVSLNAISVDFRNYGTGRLVIVDPATDQVTGTIDLPGVKNCGAMTYVAASKKLMVACNGSYTDAQPADSSAIVVIDLSLSPPAIAVKITAAAAGGFPFSNLSLAAWDGNTALALTLGDYSNVPPDRLWSLPLTGAAPAKVFDSVEAFALGAVLADPERGHILVADGTTTGALLRVFNVASGAFSAGQTAKTNPAQKLPPRALAWY